MDNRHEVQAFLTSRRAAVHPEQVGFVSGPRRRVPGLRRSEVAELAGLSVEYYARLERGNLRGASDGVLDAVAGALRLSADERSHLRDLARASRQRATDPTSGTEGARGSLRPGLVQTLNGLGAAALIVDFRMDVLAANSLARLLYADLYGDGFNDDNYARFVFLDPNARAMYRDWESVADEVVATLRTAAGRPQTCGSATSSVGSPCTALRSAGGGLLIPCVSGPSARSGSTTVGSATSNSRTRRSGSRPSRTCR